MFIFQFLFHFLLQCLQVIRYRLIIIFFNTCLLQKILSLRFVSRFNMMNIFFLFFLHIIKAIVPPHVIYGVCNQFMKVRQVYEKKLPASLALYTSDNFCRRSVQIRIKLRIKKITKRYMSISESTCMYVI